MESNKRILIVGSEGFIGSNLWKYSTKNWAKADKALEGRRIEDTPFPDWYQPDVVVLLAANLEHDLEMYQDNLSIYNWAASTFPDAHFIYTSSAAVYGGGFHPSHEDDRPFPQNLYGRSKLLGEQIIKDTKENYTILRLSNVYGKGEGNGAIDKFINGENKIYGDGQQRRDYVSVDTVVGAILKIIENPEKYNQNTYNISSNESKSVIEVFKEYSPTSIAKLAEPREFDIQYSLLDNTKAKEAGLL